MVLPVLGVRLNGVFLPQLRSSSDCAAEARRSGMAVTGLLPEHCHGRHRDWGRFHGRDSRRKRSQTRFSSFGLPRSHRSSVGFPALWIGRIWSDLIGFGLIESRFESPWRLYHFAHFAIPCTGRAPRPPSAICNWGVLSRHQWSPAISAAPFCILPSCPPPWPRAAPSNIFLPLSEDKRR